MTLDLEKLQNQQTHIFNEILVEYHDELPTSLIHLTNSKDINQFLEGTKFNVSSEVSSRVLNAWIEKKAVVIDERDSGKIKRFNRLENLWIRIVSQARKFNFAIHHLELARKQLFESPVANFNLFKYGLFLHVFEMPQVLILTEEGHPRLFPAETYYKWALENKFPPHLMLNLTEVLEQEFPKNNFGADLGIEKLLDSTNLLKLVFFLKTGEYESIKIYLNEFDVREITSTEQLLRNKALLKCINNWDLEKIEIYIDDDTSSKIIL